MMNIPEFCSHLCILHDLLVASLPMHREIKMVCANQDVACSGGMEPVGI
jgi:hypothetical protein